MTSTNVVNTTELVTRIAETLNTTKTDASVLYRAVMSTIVNALEKGETVKLHGFGTLVPRVNGPTRRRNPQTGEVFTAPARKKYLLRMSKSLVQSLNEGTQTQG